MSDQMNPMGPAEPEIMSQDAEDVIGLQPGQSDREGAMAKADLYKIANYSHKLFKQIEDQDQMEAWVQAKITKAADYIASVYHYLEYEMKFSQYGQALEDSEVYSESQKQAIKNRLMEAKEKVKELKVKQAKKAKDDAADKVSEGVLSGGHKACTECGGSGMVYEEPKAIPDHVKGKVEKYNRQAKAFHAASKRIDRNNDGIDDRLQSPDVEEGFETDAKVGSKKKTATGELTKTDTGVVHKNTSYKDDGDELDSIAKSGKGKASHAKAQSAAEKKDRAPAQKQSPKSAKTWGMKDSEKFDNRDGAPAKPKKEKEKEVDEGVAEGLVGDVVVHNYTKIPIQLKPGQAQIAGWGPNDEPLYRVKGQDGKEVTTWSKRRMLAIAKGQGDVIAGRLGKDEKGGKAVKEAAKPSAGLSAAKKSAVVKDAKAGKDIGKPGKSFDKVAKAAGGGEKGEKIAAAAMWKNIKETQAYIAEKAKATKDLPGNQEKIDVAEPKGKIDSKDMAALRAKKEVVKESADLNRMKEFLTRLNG